MLNIAKHISSSKLIGVTLTDYELHPFINIKVADLCFFFVPFLFLTDQNVSKLMLHASYLKI